MDLVITYTCLGRKGMGGRKGIQPVKNRVVECWRGFLSGLVARAFDLWLNGGEFELRPLALPDSNSGQVNHTYWPRRLQWSSAGVPGCRWETAVSVLSQLLWYAVLGTGCSTFPAVPRSTQPSTLRGMVKWVLVNSRGKVGRITSVGWQVTLCDPIWQVISQAR